MIGGTVVAYLNFLNFKQHIHASGTFSIVDNLFYYDEVHHLF